MFRCLVLSVLALLAAGCASDHDFVSLTIASTQPSKAELGVLTTVEVFVDDYEESLPHEKQRFVSIVIINGTGALNDQTMKSDAACREVMVGGSRIPLVVFPATGEQQSVVRLALWNRAADPEDANGACVGGTLLAGSDTVVTATMSTPADAGVDGPVDATLDAAASQVGVTDVE